MWAGNSGDTKRVEFNVIQFYILVNFQQRFVPDRHMIAIIFFVIQFPQEVKCTVKVWNYGYQRAALNQGFG